MPTLAVGMLEMRENYDMPMFRRALCVPSSIAPSPQRPEWADS